MPRQLLFPSYSPSFPVATLIDFHRGSRTRKTCDLNSKTYDLILRVKEPVISPFVRLPCAYGSVDQDLAWFASLNDSFVLHFSAISKRILFKALGRKSENRQHRMALGLRQRVVQSIQFRFTRSLSFSMGKRAKCLN